MNASGKFWHPPAVQAWWVAAATTAIAAGAAAAVIAGLLIWNHLQFTLGEPLESAQLEALKVRLAATSKDESLKGRIRRLDLELRQEYFARRDFSQRGIYLLVAAAVVCLLCARLSATLARKLPRAAGPGGEDGDMRLSALGRWSTAGVAATLVIAAAVVAIASRQPGRQAADYPSPQEIAKQWPRFRGPGGLGVSAYTDVPISWDGPSGEGIRWKKPVALPGRSSPVLWDKRLFLTGAVKDKRQVYCFDADSGAMVWRHTVGEIPGRGKALKGVSEDTGFAAPTPVTDGKRICAIFADGDLVCLDFEGKVQWARNIGTPDNPYGHASSLSMYRGTLLVQFDQAQEEDNKSRLIAVDVRSGKELWRTGRPVGASWTSPIVINTPDGDQIITCSNPWVIAYNPAGGTEIWRAECLEGDGGPSPTYADGMVLATNVASVLAAIRPDGRGNVTKTHIVWQAEDGLPDISSPVSNGELVFLLATEGFVTCYDIATGTKLWEKDLETPFISSPSMVGDKLYITSMKGLTTVISAARKYQPISTARLGENCEASPAFGPGRIYMRGVKHLFCIGRGKQ